MVTKFDYAALSALVYNNIKSINKLTIPVIEGWSELPIYPNGTPEISGLSLITGFNARAYSNGTDIVIAYEGTDTDTALKQFIDFGLGNTAALGFSPQLIQAALFYEKVKAANPGANITFTGHSLGGGLASVMGIWFGKSATTFDQAPFGFAVANPVTLAVVEQALVLNLYADSEFALFHPLDLNARLANITNYTVPGEVLATYLSALPSVAGTNNLLTIGGASKLPGSAFGNAVTLHSMILEASLLMSQTFVNDTVSLPQLLAEIFDGGLYGRDPTKPNRDFLSSLLSDQIKVGYSDTNGLLARFAADIDKLTTLGDNLKTGALSKAVIDIAIADYYFMQNGFTGKNFYNAITGGISFDLSDIQSPNGWSSNKTVTQLDTAIITQHLNGDNQARAYLSKDNYWSIQSGGDALNATGTGSNNDAMIGGTTGDTLDGGAGNDFLFGGDGVDTLTGGENDDQLIGGAGNDILDGGTGYDTYTIEGRDTISDADGKGQIKDKAGNLITGTIEKKQDGTYTFLSDPTITVTRDANLTLTLANGSVIVIENFTRGDLGLLLVDAAAEGLPEINYSGTAAAERILGRSELYGRGGNDIMLGLADSTAAMNNVLQGGDGNDYLFSSDTEITTQQAIDNGNTDTPLSPDYVGGDWLAGNAGNDVLIAGANDDLLAGGGGNDLLIAGAGDDVIYGDVDFNRDTQYGGTNGNLILNRLADGTAQFSAPSLVENPADSGDDTIHAGNGKDYVMAGKGNDVIYGEGDDDYLAGEEGDDVLFGGDGIDKMWGNDGNDYLEGGAGNDILNGEAANDPSYINLFERRAA